MKSTFQFILAAFARNPKILFLVDSIGALISALLLWAVLRPLHAQFGLPRTTLAYLALSAAVLCSYSACCFLFIRSNPAPFIRVIALANILYSGATAALLMAGSDRATILGFVYFTAEIIIISVLAFLEMKAAGIIGKSETRSNGTD